MATVHLGRSRPDPVAARRWLLEVVETPDGVLALDGLPEDRETRLSVLYRLRDVIAAACHLDDAHGEGDGALWRRYAARQFAVAISPATVCELVELVAQDEDTERAPPR
jgi:hypothetical protein